MSKQGKGIPPGQVLARTRGGGWWRDVRRDVGRGGIGAVALLGMGGSSAAWAETSTWTTDFGPLTLAVISETQVTGLYPQYQGRFVGVMDRSQPAIVGYWLQPTSEQRCDREVDGTAFWGRVVWRLEGGGALIGRWSYCDQPAGSSGPWNGTLVGGVYPLDVATLDEGEGEAGAGAGGDLPDKTPLAHPATGLAPASAPASDAGAALPDQMAVARFLWGSAVSPDEVAVVAGDVTCDGRPDLVLGYLNRDSPEGPFYEVAVAEPGRTLEEIPVKGLGFDGVSFGSLCGFDQGITLSRQVLDPAAAQDLTGMGPPLCPQGLRIDDGMCDALWLFTQPTEAGLVDLILGRS